VDDGDDLGEDYLLVCNAAVGRFGIEGNEVVGQHDKHLLL